MYASKRLRMDYDTEIASSKIIGDNGKQTALTGKDATITVATLNRDIKFNASGDVVDSKSNSTAHTITPIFDKEKVEREIQAQVKITQAFSQQAPVALAAFAADKIKPYQNNRGQTEVTRI